MLRALERNISDMIETEVPVSAFTREVSKTMGILPIDIIIGSKTTLSVFFVIDSTVNYNICWGETRFMTTRVCRPLFTSSYCFGKVMK